MLLGAVSCDLCFDRFNLAVYRFLTRLPTTDEAARDDLVQATFLEVQRCAANFRGASSVKTWILGVAANLAELGRPILDKPFTGSEVRGLVEALIAGEHP